MSTEQMHPTYPPSEPQYGEGEAHPKREGAPVEPDRALRDQLDAAHEECASLRATAASLLETVRSLEGTAEKSAGTNRQLTRVMDRQQVALATSAARVTALEQQLRVGSATLRAARSRGTSYALVAALLLITTAGTGWMWYRSTLESSSYAQKNVASTAALQTASRQLEALQTELAHAERMREYAQERLLAQRERDWRALLLAKYPDATPGELTVLSRLATDTDSVKTIPSRLAFSLASIVDEQGRPIAVLPSDEREHLLKGVLIRIPHAGGGVGPYRYYADSGGSLQFARTVRSGELRWTDCPDHNARIEQRFLAGS